MSNKNERPNPWKSDFKVMAVAKFELEDQYVIKEGSPKKTPWRNGTKAYPLLRFELSDSPTSALPRSSDNGNGKSTGTHRFTLILSGVAEITPDLADALYEATDGDIELNQRDGVVYLEFDRAASTLRDAITAAIREVDGAAVGVRVIRVESEAANVIAKINADLLGVVGS